MLIKLGYGNFILVVYLTFCGLMIVLYQLHLVFIIYTQYVLVAAAEQVQPNTYTFVWKTIKVPLLACLGGMVKNPI